MPIFVSRFSPERSLIGSFVAPGARRNETPERAASVTPTSAASSGTSPQGADRIELSRDLSSSVSTETPSARSAPAVSDPSAEDSTKSTPSVRSLTLLDQLRIRANSTIPSQETSVDEPAAVENPVDSPEPAPSVGVENRLGPLAERLRALTDELTASRDLAPPAAEVDSATLDDLATENQAANNTAAEEDLDILISALQDESPSVEVVSEPEVETAPAIDTQAIAAAITQQEDTSVSREAQEQTLRDGLQTIATGLRADAAIESRQNVEATARNAEAAYEVRSRREVQSNQREIQALQGDRRSAQQELRSADQAIRQLQNRNSRIQSESTQTANPGTSLDVLAQ